MAAAGERHRFVVTGIVQGVGFRPHVHTLATRLELAGWVCNTPDGVLIEVEGPAPVLAEFGRALLEQAPPLAVVDAVEVTAVTPVAETGFGIRASIDGPARTLTSPDVATCADCLAEVSDPADRRYRYEFANCTNCGPRYTIVTGIPYDRPNTTMAGFVMCPACRTEYDDPRDRRFHAQPVCCPACGPHLDTPLTDVAAALRSGGIVALKGLGGYHLAALASSEPAVARLRARKHREDKPFAVMVVSLEAASRLCDVDAAAAAVLTSPARPIVLLPTRAGAPIAPSVAPRLHRLGLMLPYTPLHHLLLEAVGEPIVLTSGNVSDEPIAYRDDDASARLGPIAERTVTHDRPIHIRVDDSVVQVVDGAPYPLRRSRGYAPAPIMLPSPTPVAVLACGAELKSTIALARGRRAFLSHHIGDLKNWEAYRSFREAVAHVGRLFEIEPEVVAHDLHPDYLSTSFALELAEDRGVPALGVQHHHAHVVSCLVDNGVEDPVIGIAFDGTGLGADGTIWGGEVLVADLLSFERVGWLAPVPLPGGDAATDEPWRMAASYLDVLGALDEAPATLREGRRWDDVVAMARAGVSSPLTSSAGRLFDAVAALVGVRTETTYEGQAAIELEACVDSTVTERYSVTVEGPLLHGADLVAGALIDRRGGVPIGTIAARFHLGLAEGVVERCRQVRETTGLDTIAVSGGVFANVVLLREVTRRAETSGFRVLRHHQVPCNDGGISLGQAAIAAARLRAGLL